MDRRKFLRLMGMAGAAAAIPWRFDLRRGFQINSAWAFAQSPGLRKFKDLAGNPLSFRFLPPLMASDGTRVWNASTTATHYSIRVGQFTDRLHPDLPNPTTLWGYGQGGAANFKHLGGIIVAQKGTPVQITFTNNLPGVHILPVDIDTLYFPDAAKAVASGQMPISTHLHGGHVPWISDGGPMAWFTPNGTSGASFQNGPGSVLDPATFTPRLVAGQGEYYYPNDQSARLMWYHDHAHDLTRLNAYAGIASGYVLRDTFEGNLRNQGLPDFIENGGHEIPLIIQDKIFVNAATIAVQDPTWLFAPVGGNLWYAHTYDPKRWKLAGNKAGTGGVPDPSAIPEFFGDTMLANGTVYPEANVEPRRYRFRILNACQARFLNLQLYVDDGSTDSITLDPLTFNPKNTKGPDFLQIGTEGGFLPKPVLLPSNVPFNPVTLAGSLIMAPAERADLIVDFSGFAGQKIVLYTDAPAPFPVGDPRNDYFPLAPKNPTITTPGFGPNTRQIMRFNVGTAVTTLADLPLTISPATDLTAGNDPLFTTIPPVTRTLTLNETFDAFGRLIQLLGTSAPLTNVGGGFGRRYMDAPTETPANNTTEVWQIVNLTGDTHPIHFHLVNVQIISRQAFAVSKYNGGAPALLGAPRPPDPNEAGWKETVRMNPGEVTTVIMHFQLPAVPFSVPDSVRPLDPTMPVSVTNPITNFHNEYVWHCHILEHEEHDMMRPLVVI